MEILRVENICKTYEMDKQSVHALSDVSFSVDKGEFVAIIWVWQVYPVAHFRWC